MIQNGFFSPIALIAQTKNFLLFETLFIDGAEVQPHVCRDQTFQALLDMFSDNRAQLKQCQGLELMLSGSEEFANKI